MTQGFIITRLNIANQWIDVHHLDSQKPTSIVFIHGVGVSGRYFIPLAQELARDYNIFLIDMPGYGKTPKPKKPLTIAQLAKVVGDYMVSTNLKGSVVIGQSMGCQVVAELIKGNPSLASKMILIGGTVNRKERTHLHQALRLMQDSVREPLKMNALILLDYFRMGVGRYIRTVTLMLDHHIEDYLENIQLPVLVMRGSNDKISPRSWNKFLTDITPHSQSVEIPHGPHNAHYKYPKETAALCRTFIEK